jgi:hypothetical protein
MIRRPACAFIASMIRPSTSLALALALALVASLPFASGCAGATPTASSPADQEPEPPPPGWRDPALGKEMRSASMVATGIVMISLGVTALPIGTLMATAGGQDCNSDETGNFVCKPASNVSGLGVLAAGAGGLAVGIPLLVLGAQKVPVEIPRRSAITVGPTGASFRYDF